MPTQWLPPQSKPLAGPHPLPPEGTLHVWRWSDTLEGSSEWLDPGERHRWERLVTPTLQQRFLAAHAGLRQLLAGYLGIQPGDVAFDLLPLGKPLLATGGELATLHFNLAHSGSLMVAAVSREEVGIDIEQVRPVTLLTQLAARHMTPNEQQALESLTGEAQLAMFYRLWTRKEACVKLVGIGLQGALDGAEVHAAPDWHGTVGLPPAWDAPWGECWVSEIAAPAEYLAAVAAPRTPREVASFVGA